MVKPFQRGGGKDDRWVRSCGRHKANFLRKCHRHTSIASISLNFKIFNDPWNSNTIHNQGLRWPPFWPKCWNRFFYTALQNNINTCAILCELEMVRFIPVSTPLFSGFSIPWMHFIVCILYLQQAFTAAWFWKVFPLFLLLFRKMKLVFVIKQTTTKHHINAFWIRINNSTNINYFALFKVKIYS